MAMSGQNVGNLLNDKGLTWGWFEGGFTPTTPPAGTKVTTPTGIYCGAGHANVANSSKADYVQHHEPFQYYESTANPYHNSPSSVNEVGESDLANTPLSKAVNHQYDLSWFYKALDAGDMPQVSFLKPPAYENGHAGNSDPLDEQRFVVDTINQIEQSPDWSNTAIIIAYDDSDGWYDHQMGPIIRQSQDAADDLSGPGKCGSTTTPPAQNDRCGVGPRLPLLVISPWAKQNYVDNTFTEQASILRFIEDNWNLGRIGNHSADASAGTLENAFDFTQRYGHAPAIIMDDNTGEITNVIPPKPPSPGSSGPAGTVTSTAPTSSGPASGTAGSGKTEAPEGKRSVTKVKLPAVACGHSSGKHAIALSCTIRGGSQVPTLIRVRLFRGRSLIGNVASRVRGDRVRFSLPLGRHARSGRYMIRMSIDAGGQVGSLTRYVRVG